jgi:hypothetical protein
MTLLGNVSRHQPLPTNADQPVASSAYITGAASVSERQCGVGAAPLGICRVRETSESAVCGHLRGEDTDLRSCSYLVTTRNRLVTSPRDIMTVDI